MNFVGQIFPDTVPRQLYMAGEQLLSVAAQLDKGCAVVDMRLPRMDGLRLLHALRCIGISIPIILVAPLANVALAVEAVKRGATDVIERPYLPDTMLSSIRLALNAPEESSIPRRHSAPVRRLPRLTRREGEVLQAMVRGKPTKEIARDLSLSPRTIEVYRANVMAKTGAENITDLVRLVMSVGADPATWPR